VALLSKKTSAEAAIPPRRVLPGSLRANKSQIASAQLEELAARLGAGTKLPRMTDLCAQLNISITTLVAALNDLEARGILQRRHGVGIFVAPELHRANIVLLCDARFFSEPGLSPFWTLLIQHVRERAKTEALGFELHFAEPTYTSRLPDAPVVSETVARLIDSGRIHGALAIGVAAKTTAYLEQRGIPLVAFAGKAEHAVLIDVESLVRQGVHLLAEAGARRLALWSPMQTLTWQEESAYARQQLLSAFQQGLAEVGLPFIPELVQQNTHRASEPGAFTEMPYQEQGYETALSVFGASALLPDGIVSTDDMLTAGALSALRRCGVRVRPPKAPAGSEHSVLIATHANVGSSVLIGDADDLCLLQVNPADVVQALFTTLEELMRGDASVSPRTYIPVTVRPRS